MVKFATYYAYGKVKKKKSNRGRKPKAKAINIEPNVQSVVHAQLTVDDGQALPSFSARKSLVLKEASDAITEVNKIEDQYLLVKASALTSMVARIKCDVCSSFCTWKTKYQKGLATVIDIYCSKRSCGKWISKEVLSPQKEIIDPVSRKTTTHYDGNIRAVFAANQCGIRHLGMAKLFGILGLKGSLSHTAFNTISNMVIHVNEQTALECMENARTALKNFHSKTDPTQESDILDIAVSFDGTWHKRGFQSLYGVGFCIDATTGIVIDYEILSKYCSLCAAVGSKLTGDNKKRWEEKHKDECHVNHDGTSGSMEVKAAKNMWQRSERYGFRYTTVISDGDCSVYQSLKTLNPYNNVEIIKKECLNHVAKRMFKGLETVVKEQAKKNFRMGGEGEEKLSSDKMKDWCAYYRMAITNGAPDPDQTIKNIWAILHHSTSTPANPKHDHCGDWCYYKKAIKEGKKDPIAIPEGHHKPLPQSFCKVLEPLFQRLSQRSLIIRCMNLATQNMNESLHSTLWARCSKSKFVGLPQLSYAVASAVQEWNMGSMATITAAKGLGIDFGPEFHKFNKRKDLKRSEQHARQKETTVSRKRKLIQKEAQEQEYKKNEGVQYQSGGF